MNEKTYCSLLSRERDDNLIGSATYYDKLFLIQYNKPWTQKAFIDSKINSAVKEFLSDFISLNKVKLLLIKKHSTDETGIRVFTFNLLPNKKFFNSFLLKKYEDLLTLDLESCFESQVQPANENIYLVCTNGKKDKCCSKFGLPVYHELAKRSKNVWQCTHVGGDRFAPNIIFLPHSLFFGHISLPEIPGFLIACESNQIYHARYRGRSTYRNYEQAAEYFLLKHLDNFLIDGCDLISSQKTNGDKSMVVFYSQFHKLFYEVQIEKELSTETQFLTCTAEKASQIPVFRLLSITLKRE